MSGTITLSITVELDDLHAEMFDDVAAAHPDHETAREALADQLAQDLREEGRIETMIYQARQRTKQQREQVAQQMQAQAGAQADGGEKETGPEPEADGG